MMNDFFRFLRRHGHPAVWLVLALAFYGVYDYRDRLYWEKPSVPFQPFCNPEGNWTPFRPIKGVTLSPEFLDAVIEELAERRISMTIVYRFPPLRPSKADPRTILVPRKDFEDGSEMISVTEFALNEVIWPRREFAGKPMKEPFEFSLECIDVEGKVKRI